MGMPANKQIACVDGLRGLAVIAVVLFHHRLQHERDALHSTFSQLLAPVRFGFSGVDLFFVLSGFCLTYSLLGRAKAGRFPTLQSYLSARWWRLAPPYYAAAALY